MKRIAHWFIREDSGQDLVEYALLAAFIATVSIAALTVLGTTVSAFYSNVAAQF